ncbi:hypothetical protein GO308_03560 [Sphingomonas sp. SFZ2018-12]|uniref:hypothetical protein n=1 Tax=Sphingomonas sp. SFZ2018-12 TaxID=2683197 RepID=UPI001F0DE87A|nr:hypothetical protein [Sphingomonas sp. SFZ2018-12]MCH4892188.1 hypothetical protein [Sphingomonas sp. SFZ2018-12]
MPVWPMLLLTLTPQDAAPAPATDGRDIVVVGTKVTDLERALAECIARNCPPNAEIDAAIALAEARFLAGAYRDARDGIDDSLKRNRQHRGAYPEPVADLYLVLSRIHSHLGAPRQGIFNSRERQAVLESAFGANDPRVIDALIERADVLLREREFDYARDLYREAARRSDTPALFDRYALARLRLARIELGAGATPEPAQVRRAEALLAPILANAAPGHADVRLAARGLLARAAVARGDGDAVEQAIAAGGVDASRSAQPVLIAAPPVDFPERGKGSYSAAARRYWEDQWVDIGFRIARDGSVGEVEQLRASEKLAGDWAVSLIASIRERRYAPLADDVKSYRIERYTLTSPYHKDRGVPIQQRRGYPVLERLDLTPP